MHHLSLFLYCLLQDPGWRRLDWPITSGVISTSPYLLWSSEENAGEVSILKNSFRERTPIKRPFPFRQKHHMIRPVPQQQRVWESDMWRSGLRVRSSHKLTTGYTGCCISCQSSVYIMVIRNSWKQIQFSARFQGQRHYGNMSRQIHRLRSTCDWSWKLLASSRAQK